ncbi:hypothetical protein ACVWWG_002705 [Bradyrhizobium sp. LB7.2]
MAAPSPSATEGKIAMIIVGIDPAHQDAEESAVRHVQTSRDDRGPFADDVAAHGFQQHRLGSRVRLESLEIGAGSDVDRGQRLGARPIDDLTLRIVDDDVAEVGHRADLAAQHLVGGRPRHPLAEHRG